MFISHVSEIACGSFSVRAKTMNNRFENRFGNHGSSYSDDTYHYTNADGSKYFSNGDGSAFYDPGQSGKGRRWYRSPSGVKHFISDEEEESSDERTQYLGSPEPICMSFD